MERTQAAAPATEKEPFAEHRLMNIAQTGAEIRNDAVSILLSLSSVKCRWYWPGFYRTLRQHEDQLTDLNRRYAPFEAEAASFIIRVTSAQKIVGEDGTVYHKGLEHVVRFGAYVDTVNGYRETVQSQIDRAGAAISALRQQAYNQTALAVALLSLIVALVALVVSAR